MRIVNIIFLITCTACVPDRLVNKSLIGGSYSVTKLKAKKSTHTIIAGKFLDYESRNRIIPATLNLNGLYIVLTRAILALRYCQVSTNYEVVLSVKNGSS